MPAGIKKGSAKEVDFYLKKLAESIKLHVEQEAENGHHLPEATLKKRLLLAVRFHQILPLRKAISVEDNFMGFLDPPSFTASDGTFEAWASKYKSLFGQDGWYLRLPDDTWEYDWDAGEFTVIPAGFGFGRAFSLGNQPVNAFLSARYNAADLDDSVGPKWAIKASFSLVFPK